MNLFHSKFTSKAVENPLLWSKEKYDFEHNYETRNSWIFLPLKPK